MPRRIDDFHQPKLAPTAGDLGDEAYRANLSDHPGTDPVRGESAGTVPVWQSPEAKNAPPGQHRGDAAPVKLGQDVKRQGGTRRRPGTAEAPQ